MSGASTQRTRRTQRTRGNPMSERDNLLHRAGWLLSLVDQYGGVSVRRSYMVSEHGPSAEATRMGNGLDAYLAAAEGIVAEINGALGLKMPMADYDEDERIVNMGRAWVPRGAARKNPSRGGGRSSKRPNARSSAKGKR